VPLHRVCKSLCWPTRSSWSYLPRSAVSPFRSLLWASGRDHGYTTLIRLLGRWVLCYLPSFSTSQISFCSLVTDSFTSGLKITCKPSEFNVFTPPPGETCGTWANEFVNAFGGYLANTTATSNCQYCQYAVGDEFFLPLNISYDQRWRDVWVIFAFFGTSPSHHFSSTWGIDCFAPKFSILLWWL
jgi:hypothetical protein